MIRRIVINHLRGYAQPELDIRLNPDINIVTGRNGAGKTTLLKAMWYLTSGNIHVAAEETPFSFASIETDLYSMTIDLTDRSNPSVEVDTADGDMVFRKSSQEELDEFDFPDEDDGALARASSFTEDFGSSLFFPTFRRVEGGFTIPRETRAALPRPAPRGGRFRNALEEGLYEIARRLSNVGHQFVCTVSTNDIVELVLHRYNAATEQYASAQKALSNEIIEEIRFYEQGDQGLHLSDAGEVLTRIKKAIEQVDAQRVELLASLNAVQNLVMELFKHRGISFGSRYSFGERAEAVLAENLSAGEKQMLSFICYNAFFSDTVIFIDEPELSLHVDWQRQLFPILQTQSTNNQFIVATHSPFIYAKYPEKELLLGEDRGASLE